LSQLVSHVLVYLASIVFTAAPTTDIYPLSLHALFRSWLLRLKRRDLPQQLGVVAPVAQLGLGVLPPDPPGAIDQEVARAYGVLIDRKSTRLNSSHVSISYAVFCLKKTLMPTRSSLHHP